MTDDDAHVRPQLPAVVYPPDDPRAAFRAALVPDAERLTRLLMELHEESAASQRAARRAIERTRAALAARLAGEVLDADGRPVDVSTRELIGHLAAEADLVKVEAMAQRAYDVHAVTSGRAPGVDGADSVEAFLRREALREPGDGDEP